GRYRDAANHYQLILAREPRHAIAANNLGKLHQNLGNNMLALDFYRRAIDLAPDFADAHFNRGTALRAQGDLAAARDAFATVLRLQPDDAAACSNLGTIYKDQGQVEEAVAWYRRAIEKDPRLREVHSNLLFTLSYHLLGSAQERLEAHRLWDDRHGGPFKAQTFTHHRGAHPTKLRIGYVSPDLKRHAVSTFLEPILAAHDHQAFEIFCYAEVAQPDEITERLRIHSDGWRDTTGRNAMEVARQIHEDGIHILVDLAGHTSGNRLDVFAYKPAPVQLTYLGYCATTGLAAMDYWITDEVLMPPDSPEMAVEEIVRLPRCWLCYQPPSPAPAVKAQRGGGEPVTFGSFNHLSKLSDAVLACWSQILGQLPHATLLLKTQQLADPAVQEQILNRFAAHGVEPQRLRLEGASSDYLERYNAVDIALDPFPRTGGATSADALWMGTPVITLVGRFVIERQGASMLTALELKELVADSEEQYIAKAVQLARDPQTRQNLHQNLRQRMQASPLCDGPGLATALEDCYRRFWQHFQTQA
ncbi:MAG: tetratricopeptide repeat protein, partial [Anaerolineae bacterium]